MAMPIFACVVVTLIRSGPREISAVWDRVLAAVEELRHQLVLLADPEFRARVAKVLG